MRSPLPPEWDAIWPNCTIPDCCNKACVGLSDYVCFPHYFKLPMNSEGNAVFPNEAIKEEYHRILHEALEKLK